MATPIRGNTARRRRRGQSTLRTIGAFFFCAILSFALGFFVLARFWAGASHAQGVTGPAIAAGSPDTEAMAHGPLPPPVERRHAPPAPTNPPPTANPPGPRIDPAEEEAQRAHSIDADGNTANAGVKGADANSGANSGANVGDNANAGDNADTAGADRPDKADKRQRGAAGADAADAARKSAGEFSGTDGTDDSAQSSAKPDAAGPRRNRRPRRNRADQERVAATPAKATDPGDDSGNRGPKPGTQDRTSPNGLYRVQLGIYSTRENADEAARRAVEKGFATTVQNVSSEGRTLYRVQHSAHHSRANADAEKQRLIDAGFEAYVSGAP